MPGRRRAVGDAEILKKQPSAKRWELEIRRILNGEREHTLLKLGGVQEYVRVLIRASRDSVAAETAFREALRAVVEEWQPAGSSPGKYVVYMLDLIGAFLPAAGFGKVIHYLQRGVTAGDLSEARGTFDEVRDLTLSALSSLRGFYHASPPSGDQNPAFRAYMNILLKYLNFDRYCGYTAMRLIELEGLAIDDPVVAELVKKQPAWILEIVPFMVAERRSRIEEISSLYVQCLEAGIEALDRFNQALRACDALLEQGDQGPVIRFPSSGESVTLKLPLTALELYSRTARWTREAQERGLKKFRAVGASAAGTE